MIEAMVDLGFAFDRDPVQWTNQKLVLDDVLYVARNEDVGAVRFVEALQARRQINVVA